MSAEHEQPEATERWPAGRRIIERIRSEINAPDGPFTGEEGEDVFRSLYLTERFGCIPDHFLGDDLMVDIRSMYYWVLDGVRNELQERFAIKTFLWVVVDPSYEDSTYALLLHDDRVLLQISRKAWHFSWESEDEMAEELQEWYEQAASAVRPPAPAPPEGWPAGRGFIVTLNTERVIFVGAEDRDEALEQARAWQSNEDDPGVQLAYEEVIRSDATPFDATKSNEGGGP